MAKTQQADKDVIVEQLTPGVEPYRPAEECKADPMPIPGADKALEAIMTDDLDAMLSGDLIGALMPGIFGGMGNRMANRGKTHFRRPTLAIIDKANKIIAEYGGGLTLRQLYYQFVARGLLPNTKKDYERLGKVIGDARLAGLIDWNAIIDRTRTTNSNSHFESPADILDTVAAEYQLDSRAGQDVYIEVWIEKEALIGVIEPICSQLDVLYLACRGYYSLSAMWAAAASGNAGLSFRLRNELF